MNYSKAEELIIDSLKENLDPGADSEQVRKVSCANADTMLFGVEGLLDSLGVVILLTDLEEKLDDEYDVEISLASDVTMSKTRSPFRSVSSLAKYIVATVEEKSE